MSNRLDTYIHAWIHWWHHFIFTYKCRYNIDRYTTEAHSVSWLLTWWSPTFLGIPKQWCFLLQFVCIWMFGQWLKTSMHGDLLTVNNNQMSWWYSNVWLCINCEPRSSAEFRRRGRDYIAGIKSVASEGAGIGFVEINWGWKERNDTSNIPV